MKLHMQFWNSKKTRLSREHLWCSTSPTTKASLNIGSVKLQYSISQFMQEQLSANVTSGTGRAAVINVSVGFNGVAFNRQLITPVLRYIWNRDKLNINSTFGTLATSMTNVIRGTDWGLGTPDEGGSRCNKNVQFL